MAIKEHSLRVPDRERRQIQAQVDLHEQALGDFLETIKDWTDATLKEELAADASWNNEHILRHVVTCIYFSYFPCMEKALGRDAVPVPVAGVEALDGIHAMGRWRELLRGVVPYVRQVTEGWRDTDLDQPLTTRWGAAATVDLLFEHATMHLYRHIRQIERDRVAKAAVGA